MDPYGRQKRMLAQKLMGRAFGNKTPGAFGGNLFRNAGLGPRPGHMGITFPDSTNPYAISGLGGAIGHAAQGEASGYAGEALGAVGSPNIFDRPGAVGQPLPGGVTPPELAAPSSGGGGGMSQPSSPSPGISIGGGPILPVQPDINNAPTGAPTLQPYGPAGGGLIPMGDGRFYDPSTGQITGGVQSSQGLTAFQLGRLR